MVERGGGVRQVELRKLKTNPNGKTSCSLDLTIDVCDAMGANIINTLSEKAKEIVGSMGFQTGISILSNYCVKRTAVAEFKMPVSGLAWKGAKGEEVAKKIL